MMNKLDPQAKRRDEKEVQVPQAGKSKGTWGHDVESSKQV